MGEPLIKYRKVLARKFVGRLYQYLEKTARKGKEAVLREVEKKISTTARVPKPENRKTLFENLKYVFADLEKIGYNEAEVLEQLKVACEISKKYGHTEEWQYSEFLTRLASIIQKYWQQKK